MALRDQPYLPLYVQDFLTDEKLNECSASATGVYIRLMCIMHKSREYGAVLLKQNSKQNKNFASLFACKLVKHMPYDAQTIEQALEELLKEDVLVIEGDKLTQPRMVKDNNISLIRAEAGSKGGKTTQFAKAKVEANSEYENENENIKEKEILEPFIDEWFRQIWEEYPKKLGKKAAYKHFKATVHNQGDFMRIKEALKNYKNTENVKEGKYIQNGSTWFNNWEDWVHYQEPPKPKVCPDCNGKGIRIVHGTHGTSEDFCHCYIGQKRRAG